MAEAHYDTVPAASDEEQPPLDRRAQITWSTVHFQKAVEKDAHGEAILMSNGTYFSPPPIKDVSRWQCSVRKNVSVVPVDVLTYRDKLNSNTFTIDGVSIGPEVAKITSIQIGDEKREGDDHYRVFGYTLEFDDVDKWHGKYLNQSKMQKVPGNSKLVACVDSHGCPVREAVPLDENGEQIALATPADSTFTDYRIYDTIDFSVLPLA